MNQSRVLISVSNVNINTRAAQDILNDNPAGGGERIEIFWPSSMANKTVRRIDGKAFYYAAAGNLDHLPLILECGDFIPLAGDPTSYGTVQNSGVLGAFGTTALVTQLNNYVIHHNFKQKLTPFNSFNGIRCDSLQIMSPYANTATIGSVEVLVDLSFWID